MHHMKPYGNPSYNITGSTKRERSDALPANSSITD